MKRAFYCGDPVNAEFTSEQFRVFCSDSLVATLSPPSATRKVSINRELRQQDAVITFGGYSLAWFAGSNTMNGRLQHDPSSEADREDLIHLCTELEHPDSARSIEAAVNENPANIFIPDDPAPLARALAEMDAPLVAVLWRKMWRPGRTLNIAFIGNVHPIVREKITSYARQWLEYVNLEFNFVDGTTGDIRIATNPGGSWSYLGTDATLRPSHEPTMNYGWLKPDTSDTEYSRVVLHEFGHALGAIHEHQHPSAGIPWDTERVYAYYARQGWSREQVDNNIFRRYGADQLNSSSYDRDSIMHYAVPNELTIGDWEIGWNTLLSSTDKAHFRRLYP